MAEAESPFLRSIEFPDVWVAIGRVLDTPTMHSLCASCKAVKPLGLAQELKRRLKTTELELECAQHGFLDLMQAALLRKNPQKEAAENFYPPFSQLRPLITQNQTKFLNQIKQNGKFPSHRKWALAIVAAAGAHIHILDWLKTEQITWGPDASYIAGWNGHLTVLEWAQRNVPSMRFFPAACRGAARGGHVNLCEWIFANENLSVHSKDLCANAARGGQLETLKWLLSKGLPIDEYACHMAAYGGHLEILNFLRERDCPWDSDTCSMAALGGHLDILIWARQNGCEWDENTCHFAILARRRDIAEWALSNGCPQSMTLAKYAARTGDLETLKWAIENGSTWKEVSSEAAKNGHLRVLKYAIESGCPWSSDTLVLASVEGNFEIFTWALKNGCPLTLSQVEKEIKLDYKTKEWLIAQPEFEKLCVSPESPFWKKPYPIK